MRHRVWAVLIVAISALLISPAQSLAAALVRFVHAVPAAGKVDVEVSQGGSEQSVGEIGFGDVTAWHNVRSGSLHWALVSGSKTLAQGTTTLGDGAYDLVLLAKSPAGVTLGVYRTQAGRAGTALVRIIHAAPELGSPQLRADSKLVAPKLNFTQATPYLALSPGAHTLSANPAGDAMPLIQAHVTLASGQAYSFVVVGSDGQRVRVVPLVDRGLTKAAASTTASPAAAAAQSSGNSDGAGSVLVEAGDSLWTIARTRLGDSASDEAIYHEYVKIWSMNAARIGTGDPSLIFPGQRLTLPSA